MLFSKCFLKNTIIGFSLSFIVSQEIIATETSSFKNENVSQTSNTELPVDFRAVAKKAIPAVVSIKVQGMKSSSNSEEENDVMGGSDLWEFFGLPKRGPEKKPFEGQASGVLVSPDGYILTNSHVVHGMNTIVVQLGEGSEYTANVLGDDPNSDLALIKIDGKDLPFIPLGNSDDLEVGQWVAAIGNPFGLQATLTVGVVSAKGRNNLDIAKYEDFIQTDAAINRGNSGGALITLQGSLIGINTAIATTGSAGYMGIGFAIPSNMAKSFMSEILTDGKVSRGFLGLHLQSMDKNLATALDLKQPEGALVAHVSPESPAAQAGMQTEDVILKANDRKVENASTLKNFIYLTKPGTTIQLTILRKGQMMTIPVVIGEIKDTTNTSEEATPPNNEFGIEVSSLNDDLAKKYNIEGDDKGAVITHVNPTGVAAVAGLKKGAIILAINRQKIDSADTFYKILEGTPKDKPLLLQIKQEGTYLFLSLQTHLTPKKE